jgi:uncharacterized protein (DUF1499 family)
MPVFSLSGKRPNNLGVQGNRLTACPPSPNCVCSDEADGGHFIAPFLLAVSPEKAWRAVRDAVAQLPHTRIVTARADYLHAECTSAFFGFVDDLELHLRPQEGLIAVRSASRIGHSDFGVNRKRLEALRAALASKHVLR